MFVEKIFNINVSYSTPIKGKTLNIKIIKALKVNQVSHIGALSNQYKEELQLLYKLKIFII